MADDQPLGEESQLCRLCLAHEDLVWIFDERMKDDVREIIRTTSGVEILPSDIVTQKVCVSCLQITIKMFKFRTTAIKNDRDLKAKYGQLEQKNKPTTSVTQATSSHPTNKKQKTTADIDILPQELSKIQEKGRDQPQNMNASVRVLPPQPQLRRIHPSVMKIMRENPGYKLPKMSKNEDYLPVITLLRNEVVDWFKNRNYTDSDIERQRWMALNCRSTPVTADQQDPAAVAITIRRKAVADVRQLPALHQTSGEHQNDNKEIRLPNNISIRPMNSIHVQAQIRCAPLEKLTNKHTSVTACNNNESEDIDGIISALLSKTKQFSSKYPRACPLSKKRVCDIQSTSAVGNGSDVSSTKAVDGSENKKDSALNLDKQCSLSVRAEASLSSSAFKSSEIRTEHDSSTSTIRPSRKRKASVTGVSNDGLGNDSAKVDVIATQEPAHSQSAHRQQQVTSENISGVVAVKKSKSPLTIVKQPEPQQQVRVELDTKGLLTLKCTECPATYDRLFDFNVHMRFHADRKTLRQYRPNGAPTLKNAVTIAENCSPTGEKSVVAPSPSPTPSTNSNSIEALSCLDNADNPSTSDFLIPKSTGSKLFPCKICDSLHCTERDLKIHVRRRHTRCQFCAARFKTPEERDEHIDLSCGVTRVLKNLKPAEIKLTKVDLDETVKQKYPRAFGLPPRNEAGASRQRPAILNSSNHQDLVVQEDTSRGVTAPAAMPEDDVIRVSDDETCEGAVVAEQPQSPDSTNNVFRPTITVVDNNLLQGVDIVDDDISMMKFILTKMVYSQDGALETPADKDISVDAANDDTAIFKNLRKHLYKHNVAVEIQHGDKLSVSYNHEETPAKAVCDNHWNLLPPKQLMSYKEILERQKLINARAAQSSSTTTALPVGGMTNARNSTVHQTQVENGRVQSR